jgi:hypothetical protein
MDVDSKPCHHQLQRPPDLVSNGEGVSYLLFECLLCGCGIGMRLNPEGEIEGEFVIPAARKCA